MNSSRLSRTRVLSVVNYKGGTGKSTTAAYLLHTLRRLYGNRVIGIDADPQGSLTRWHSDGEWDLPVFGMATNRLHAQMWGVVDRGRYDIVVIDTPPLEQEQGVVVSALRAATDVIVPLAPTTMELDRVGPIMHAVREESEHPNRDGVGLPARVLLNRTVHNAAATAMIRDVLTASGHNVIGQTIPNRHGMGGYGSAFGGPVDDADAPYSAVASELLATWGSMPKAGREE